MKHLLIIIFLISLPLYASEENAVQKSETNENKNIEQKEPPLKDRKYFYQHKLLPKWTFETNGAFYKDLMKGNLARLKSVAEEIISPEFANNISTKIIKKYNGVLLTFKEPSFMGDCFFIFIREIDNKYLYVTYEKTRDIANEGFIGVVGNWTSDGSHHSHGPRKYNDSDSFISDAIQVK